MAFTIAHKIPVVGEAFDVLEAIYDYFVANAGRFEIVASDGIGVSGGWLVVRQVGGTGWELWIGAYISGGSGWANGNTLAGSSAQWSLSYALAPAGGWSTGGDLAPPADDPGSDMFSTSPEAGAWWGKIRPWTGAQFFTPGELHWLTILDDPATGALIILIDKLRNNTWDYGLLVSHVDSRFAADDDYPVIALAGTPQLYDNTSWIYDGDSTMTWSTILLPGDTTQGICSPDGLLDLDINNQPNPVNAKYDLPQIGIKCDTAGIKHNRGLVKAATIRQCSSGLGERTILGGGALGSTWIVLNGLKRLVIPWDGSIVP